MICTYNEYVWICLAEVQRDSGSQKEQLAQLQLVLTNLDKERDSLQEEVDQKADKINDLEKTLCKQVLEQITINFSCVLMHLGK